MELLVRFLVGGAAVCAFAAIGQLFNPKTFSGLFGAAPSVAIASLALAFAAHSKSYVAFEASTMIIGSIAMLVYSVACIALTRRKHTAVWLDAAIAWIAWFVVAFSLFHLAQVRGLL